ncbi:hypothetical protein ACFCYX_02400 [Streptomyces populi]|nr:hypothetical protein [Streptomyces populi]
MTAGDHIGASAARKSTRWVRKRLRVSVLRSSQVNPWAAMAVAAC